MSQGFRTIIGIVLIVLGGALIYFAVTGAAFPSFSQSGSSSGGNSGSPPPPQSIKGPGPTGTAGPPAS